MDGRRVRGATALSDGQILVFGGHAAAFRWLSADDREALEAAAAQPLSPVRTASPNLATVETRLRRLAASELEILLVGETGTGKEVYAQQLHAASGRKGAFVPINCAALPSELVESELFGYARGAHSQATAPKKGLIEEAEGGTLFLDELGDMSHTVQAKLLRFLQEREIVPLGATRARRIDVRVIAAAGGGTDGRASDLREDLLGRLGATAFRLPPLRARREDIGALFSYFLPPKGPIALDPALFMALCLYPWPRNIRELKKVAHAASLLAGSAPELTLAHVPDEISALLSPAPPEPRPASTETEPSRRPPRPIPTRAELESLLAQHKGNITEVARVLDRQRRVIDRAVSRYGIDVSRYRVGR